MAVFYGYARVSTKDQEKKYSIQVQRKYLEEQAKREGLPFEFYSEAESGKSIDGRYVLQDVLNKLNAGDVLYNGPLNMDSMLYCI